MIFPWLGVHGERKWRYHKWPWKSYDAIPLPRFKNFFRLSCPNCWYLLTPMAPLHLPIAAGGGDLGLAGQRDPRWPCGPAARSLLLSRLACQNKWPEWSYQTPWSASQALLVFGALPLGSMYVTRGSLGLGQRQCICKQFCDHAFLFQHNEVNVPVTF